MMKYLIIQLCDSAPSFCHCQNPCKTPRLIGLEDLQAGIVFAMKHNLCVQFVYPNEMLPSDYHHEIEQVEHTDIISVDCQDKQRLDSCSVLVVDGLMRLASVPFRQNVSYVVRTDRTSLLASWQKLIPLLQTAQRVNIVVTDVERMTDADFEQYKIALSGLSEVVKVEYMQNHLVQCNLLTDRFMLDEMNNCNAGVESVSLMPDGKFYVCPAFYFYKGEYGLGSAHISIGDVKTGLNIGNQRIYTLACAPLCRICDAYQCRRCVWLNRRTTNEVNIPSHEQCVMSHLERNATRMLLLQLQEKGTFLPEKEIKEIDYLDPFDVRPKW